MLICCLCNAKKLERRLVLQLTIKDGSKPLPLFFAPESMKTQACLSSLLSLFRACVCRACWYHACWYHACMHHGPANKLHGVATLLPLSISCQVEPFKRSPSSLQHPSIHPSFSLHPPTLPIPVHSAGLGGVPAPLHHLHSFILNPLKNIQTFQTVGRRQRFV